MNILKSLVLFLFISLLPAVLIYLIFDGFYFKIFIGAFLFLWGILYIHLDKLILMLLRAREVVETDEQHLFQAIKNHSYKSKMVVPKVYLYTGSKIKCFALQSRNEWAIVLDRKLLSLMNDEQKDALVKYLYSFKGTNLALIQTKVMGIYLLLFNITYWLMRNILFLKDDSIFFKVLSIFIFGMVRPLLAPLEIIGKRTKDIPADPELKSFFNRGDKESLNYNDFVFSHLLKGAASKDLLLKYIEGFPVLENCRFNEKEFQKTI